MGTVMPSCRACADDEAGLGVVAGHEDRLGVGRLDGRELGVRKSLSFEVISVRQ
jgi:hypothetical protein